jgi:NADH dehydrogenase
VPKGEDIPVPQMDENCEQSSEIAAHNNRGGRDRRMRSESYEPRFHGAMLCIGGRTASRGSAAAKKKVSLPSFLAMFVKPLHQHHLFHPGAGVEQGRSYLKHSLYDPEPAQISWAAHFSNRSPSIPAVAASLAAGLSTWSTRVPRKSLRVVVFPPSDRFLPGRQHDL